MMHTWSFPCLWIFYLGHGMPMFTRLGPLHMAFPMLRIHDSVCMDPSCSHIPGCDGSTLPLLHRQTHAPVGLNVPFAWFPMLAAPGGGGGGFSRFPGPLYMEFPCKELTENGITWNSHVLVRLRASVHGLSHVNDLAYEHLYMAYPMSMTSNNFPGRGWMQQRF